MVLGVAIYCENADCAVLIFQVSIDDYSANKKNCPGCGQFGRVLGDQK